MRIDIQVECANMNQNVSLDFEIMFQTLRYAARQIVSELDPELLAYHSLEMVADFSHSNNLALILINEPGNDIRLAANLKDGSFSAPNTKLPWTDYLKNVFESKKACQRKAGSSEQHLLTDIEQVINESILYCLPLIGTKNKVSGFIVLLVNTATPLNTIQEEILGVLTTMIATTIENVALFQLATIDGLTGLYVRRYLDIRLQEEITRLNRTESSLALVMTDIDHFKNVNDTYGHQQGDVILQELAQLIRTAIRKDLDIPCRFGGEEFIIILPSTGLEGAIVFAERLRRRCEAHLFTYGEDFMRITISAGVAAIDTNHLLSKDEFLKSVDEKLYDAKTSGRNKVRF